MEGCGCCGLVEGRGLLLGGCGVSRIAFSLFATLFGCKYLIKSMKNTTKSCKDQASIGVTFLCPNSSHSEVIFESVFTDYQFGSIFRRC
jgi:hypothetical protein